MCYQQILLNFTEQLFRDKIFGKFAPVVQWIELETSKLLMGVRFPPGVQGSNEVRAVVYR